MQVEVLNKAKWLLIAVIAVTSYFFVGCASKPVVKDHEALDRCLQSKAFEKAISDSWRKASNQWQMRSFKCMGDVAASEEKGELRK